MAQNVDDLRGRFQARFGRAPTSIVRAPGRVNLIGEHTDYNDGYVLPIAIERQTVALAAARDGDVIRMISLQAADRPAELTLQPPLQPGEPTWANYCKGVAAGLLAHGAALVGCDILFDSDVPIGGGLSSSASLEVATAMALLQVAHKAGQSGNGQNVSPEQMARICQAAEHEFAGAPCGIMDQSIAILGREGRALLLDCRNGQTIQLPFDDPDLVVLVVDTEVHHEIAGGEYAKRRATCYSAAEKMGLKTLREGDADMVEQATAAGKLTELETKRARHVVTEIKRTVDAIGALRAGDYREFGQLMYGSHASLRDEYEVTCEALDLVVELARPCRGVYGARMTGGGFGGCAIILVERDQVAAVTQVVQDGFAQAYGRRPPVFATRAVGGATVIE